MQGRIEIDRRRFMAAGAAFAGAALGLTGGTSSLLAQPAMAERRRLKLYNVRTDEQVEATYWTDGRYLGEALMRFDRLLRDIPTGEVKPIGLDLLDLLYAVHRKLRSNQPYLVISGYRSPATNRKLAKRRSGVAKHSLHIEGKAVDLLLPGQDLSGLAETARSFGVGGVGYYPDNGFVHLDSGPPRHWVG